MAFAAIHGLYYYRPMYLLVKAILGSFLLQFTSCKGEYTMNLLELLLIAIGLSMDAFAVSLCSGLTMPKVTIKKALIIGLYFGFFQGAMPLMGYLLGTQFADKIIAFDHWIAFVLLCIIGGKMVVESFAKEGCADRECPLGKCTDRECPPEMCTDRECPAMDCTDRECPGGERPEKKEVSLKPAEMLPLAIATSIDALAVGVSFAFLDVNIVPAVSSIGIITLTLSVLGVKIGNIFGVKFKSKAELAGGIILVLIGLKILLEHMGIISF